MISANDLDNILKVLNDRKVNVFRYKCAGEEIEIVIPGEGSLEVSDSTTQNTTGLPQLNLIGFHGREVETED